MSTEDFDAITATTLADYQRNAEGFREGTRGHDVSQNVEALLRHIDGPPPYRILDFGCGPGRDLATFRRLGHQPVGLEGTPRFVEMARVDSGCEVWQQNFLALRLPAGHFDGIFANASLFHVPGSALPRVLGELFEALRPGGVLFSSNPRGDNREGWNGQRYGAYHDYPAWKRLLEEAGFVELEHYYRPPGLPREQQLELVRHGRGSSGENPDYVLQTHEHLRKMGIFDPVLAELAHHLDHIGVTQEGEAAISEVVRQRAERLRPERHPLGPA